MLPRTFLLSLVAAFVTATTGALAGPSTWPGCRTDADCEARTPLCRDARCVGCDADLHRPAGHECGDAACVPRCGCLRDTDCPEAHVCTECNCHRDPSSPARTLDVAQRVRIRTAPDAHVAFPSVARLPDGRWLVAYREGSGHVDSVGRIVRQVGSKDLARWTAPETVLDLPEMFLLDVEQVTATYRFENGTEVTGALGEALTVTLPSDEDANGDGRVDATITYTVAARFYHVVLVIPTIKWGSVRLGLEASAYDYQYDFVDGQPQIVGETESFHDSFGPYYDSEWNFNLSIDDFTGRWKLQGFNTATTRGSIQLAPGGGAGPGAPAATASRPARGRLPSAELLLRVLDVDALKRPKCATPPPKCATPLVVLAFLTDPKIVRHTGTDATLPTASSPPTFVSSRSEPPPRHVEANTTSALSLPPRREPLPAARAAGAPRAPSGPLAPARP